MEMMIHCPSCQARLNVSKQAVGHTVRCPKCKGPFKVPQDDREIVEDTVACWLEISAEEEQARQQQAAAIPDSLDDLPEYVPPPDLPDLSEVAPHDGGQVSTAIKESKAAVASVPATKSPAKSAPASSAAAVEVKTMPVAAPRPATAPAPRRAPSAVPEGAEPDVGPVRLEVLETHTTGVVIAFDSHLLNRTAFRASMPLVCVQCGERDPAQLIARPLVWGHFLTNHAASARAVSGKYELGAQGHGTMREVLAAMRPVEEMLPPYNNPMPYCGCKRCGPSALVQTDTRSSGPGTTCYVTIPQPLYALEWLGRVNGICGDDYLALEAFCARSGGQSEAFNQLPEQIRKRLGGWYQPVDGEQFILYLKDGDYPKSDAGLGGLILTDQRMVYCKYHKHGSLPLADEQLRLLAHRQGAFDELMSVRDGVRSKLVRLRPDDTQRLVKSLEELGSSVTLERVET